MKKRLSSLGLLALGIITGISITVGLEGSVLHKWNIDGHGIAFAIDSKGYSIGFKLEEYEVGDAQVALEVAENDWLRSGVYRCKPYMVYGGSKEEKKFMSINCPWIVQLENIPEPMKPNGKETIG